jgi:hypothetical protein
MEAWLPQLLLDGIFKVWSSAGEKRRDSSLRAK